MDFNLVKALEILRRTPAVLRTLLTDLPPEWTMSGDDAGNWSPYDIVGHLIHGERTDWIPRLQIIMSAAGDHRFVPYDRFAQFQESQGKSLEELLNSFESLRKECLQKLDAFSLTTEDLQRKGIHPELGAVTLEQLLATWVVHDLSHVAQLGEVMARQYKAAVGPWTAYFPVLQAE
jgi:uncharacterized damage-inducible protein DinB